MKHDELSSYHVEAFGKCFYYFCDKAESLMDIPDVTYFIRHTVDCLDRAINLYHYDLVIYPQSRNAWYKYMMRYIYRFNQPRLRYYEEFLVNQSDEELCSIIKKQNVLVIADENTDGSTLNEILYALRSINNDNEITVFSLIACKDLVAKPTGIGVISKFHDWTEDLDWDKIPSFGPFSDEEAIARIDKFEEELARGEVEWISDEEAREHLYRKYPWLKFRK